MYVVTAAVGLYEILCPGASGAGLLGGMAVVSRKIDTESKGYPLFRFGTGREGGCRSLHPEGDRRR